MTHEYDFVFGTENNTAPAQTFAPFNTLVYTALLVLVAVTAFLVGIMFERRTNSANNAEMASFWQVWDILEESFYGEMPSVQDRKYGAIQGLVQTLNDPFTSFSPPEVASVRRQELDGHFGGVGIVIRANEQFQVLVVSVIPGNPADDAGIQAGDIFLEVDGQSVEGYTTDRIADMVRGEIGTEVVLKMLRPTEDETYEATLTRAIIEQPTVYSEDQEGIAYVRLAAFNGVALSQLQEQMARLVAEDPRGIILDLRANGGGLLDQSVQVADMFLADGVVLTQRSSDGSVKVERSDDGDLAEDLPLVVLVDGGTASAAEVVAGALQDRDRAILIGQQTYGKGVVQQVYNLNDGSQLRVTSSAWYTPKDRAIHPDGLTPDLPIAETYDTQGNDLVLQAALDHLNDLYPADEEEDEE